MLPQEIESQISTLVTDFAAGAEVRVKQLFAKRGVQLTGELINSVKVNVLSDKDSLKKVIELTYHEYGKIQGSKTYFAGKGPVQILEEWVKQRGLAAFQFIPSYTNKIPSLDVAARRIAYGIFLANRTSNKFRPSNKFFVVERDFFRTWSRVRDEIIARYAETLLDRLATDTVNSIELNQGVYNQLGKR